MQQIKSSLDLSHSLWESVNIFQNIFSLFCRTTLCYWKTTLWAFFLRLLVCTTLYRFVSYFLCMYRKVTAFIQLNVVLWLDCCSLLYLYFVLMLFITSTMFASQIIITDLRCMYFRRNVLFRIVGFENCWVYIVTINFFSRSSS